ncbi:MAG: hypothetical protein JJ858_05640 [Rhizobiaceae bacterium]|nr:hypothetical protein [Rhizobiaceae bacterium]
MSKLLILSAFALSMSTSLVLADSSIKELEKIEMQETAQGSLIVFGCPTCNKEEEDTGPVLESGSQIFEMRKVGEDEKLYRVENWLGGSPVAFAHRAPTPESIDILLGNKPDVEVANIDDNSVSSIGVTEPTRLAIYGPAEPVEVKAVATLENGEERVPLGPDIEPNLMPAVAATAAMPSSDEKVVVEDQPVAMVKEPVTVKELETDSFSLRLN